MSRRAKRFAGWGRALAIAAPLIAVVGLVAGAPAVLAALGRSSGQGPASGYDRLVDAIAQRQWLSVRYDDEGEPRIALRDGPVGRDPRLRAFVNASYLRADLQDPAVWRLSDDGQWVEGIDPFAHHIDRPYSGGGAWAGPILFRGGAAPGLRLQPLGNPAPAPIRLEPQGAPAAACDILMPTRRAAAAEPRRALSICLKDGDQPPHAVGSVMLVGDQAVVRVQTPSMLEIRVGDRDARPRVDGDVTLTPLPPGETLTLRTGQSVLRLRLDGGAADIAHSTPSGARAYFPALQPLAQPIERAMTGRSSAPLRLSLDARLQQVAQDALAAGVATVRSSALPGAKPDPGDAFKAAVTVMDTTTGQVLAVGSWPLAETDLAPAQRRTRRGQNLMDQNHNFERLPVGSMVKGPFSLAILDADPGLASLKIQGGGTGRIRTVLGMDLGKGGFDNHGLGMTDFPTFLEHSNNRYALALMMLAYRDPTAPSAPPRAPPGPVEAWSLDGKSRTDAPPLPVFGEATAPGPFGWVLRPPPGRGPAWPDRLARLFDLDAGQGGGCRYDLAVWRGLTGAAPPCASPLAGASPERERLGFDAVASFRNDYLMAVLGGSRSTWSAIKMAEVYSRIVTGRAVRARFTPASAGPPEAQLPMRNPHVRAPVLDGLSRVVKTGTAAWLGREFATMGYPPDVTLYGKTGTMKVAGEAPSEPGPVLLRQLARGDCGLRWDTAAGVLKFGYVAPKSKAEATRQILGLKETRCKVRVAGRRDLAEQAAAEMQRYACGYRNCRPGDFEPEPDGRVMDLPLRAAEPPLLDGHAIAVVAVRQANGQSVRGLTIVVNLQDKRQAETPALAVAAAILRSQAAHAWIAGGGQ
ncbi:hypothetical protein [Caulobacter sp. RL271]|jgi:hypothetical protein|uniref:Penicillin-binding protein transpeptidase domain-containing protein n=1 Tax=Caulobacter segnis TaxID=88688 RepID=A0ABY4ZXX0_9CAUL|nr:hypothetical protein [Caulobacter segnis]USQ97548.1 hypothetical protein MZV50_08435 [Caulobacter segnis]